MNATNEIESHLKNVLKQTAQVMKLKDYTIKLNVNVERGDGFLGEFFKASIIDEETNTEHFFALKKAPSGNKQRQEMQIENVYENEIRFYSEVLPTLQAFEQEHHIEAMQCFPKYVTCCAEIGKELLVLKDITTEGFELREKNLLLDDEHAKLIFKTYGRYHAISFCLKEQKREVFEKLTEGLHDIFKNSFKMGLYDDFYESLMKECYDLLDPVEDVQLREAVKKYFDRTVEMFLECLEYKGKYAGILHGDCWSNNMMFKYQNSKLADIKLLDFQLIKVGTPIFDLSYFFYTGGCKELFDNLENYLDIYHQNFSETVKKMGCDPETLLPRRSLSEEWKTYARYGMILAIMLSKIKLISKKDTVQMIDNMSNEVGEKREPYEGVYFDKDVYKKRIRDILMHTNEIGVL